MESFLHLVCEMAPFLLLGFLLAGLMHAFIPGRFYSRYLSANRFRSVVNAAAFGIPLPTGIYVPVTVEEQIICYADKYFSKSHPDVERTYEQTCRSVARWGDDCLATFMAWHRRFC